MDSAEFFPQFPNALKVTNNQFERPRAVAHLLAASVTTLGYASIIVDWEGATPDLRFDNINRAFYMLSAFPIFGVLVGDLGWNTHAFGWRAQLRAVGALAVLCGLALLRLTLHIPLSGHVALATFALFWTASVPPGALRVSYRMMFAGADLFFLYVHGVTPNVTALAVGAALGIVAFRRLDELPSPKGNTER